MRTLICFLILVLQSYVSKSQKEITRPFNFLEMEFQSDYSVDGKLYNDISYWVGFDNKQYYQEDDFKNVLTRVAGHIAEIKDSLGRSAMQKKLRIVLYPDGKTATFRLQKTDGGKEFTYYNGDYLPLKTTYDTVEIVHRKKEAGKEHYVLYTFSLKNINDLPEAASRQNNVDTSKKALEDQIAKKSPLLNKLHLGFSFGATVNSALPVAPHLEVTLAYFLNGHDKKTRQFVGLYGATAIGVRSDSVRVLTDVGIEFGSVIPDPGYLAQKASLVFGAQFLNVRGEQYGKPMLMLGFNFPVSKRIGVGFKIGSDFKVKDNKNPNPRSNVGVNVKFNL